MYSGRRCRTSHESCGLNEAARVRFGRGGIIGGEPCSRKRSFSSGMPALPWPSVVAGAAAIAISRPSRNGATAAAALSASLILMWRPSARWSWLDVVWVMTPEGSCGIFEELVTRIVYELAFIAYQTVTNALGFVSDEATVHEGVKTSTHSSLSYVTF